MLSESNNTTEYSIQVEFTHPDSKETEVVEVYPSFQLFMKTFNAYVKSKFNVTMSGNDNAIWNMFVDFSEYAGKNLFEMFMDDEDFVNELKKNYLNSTEYEADIEDWTTEFNQL